MPDFTIRADSVDVEQIMRQIRARIRDKRGVDYTEEQIRELAAAKLERFLDPTGVRSDLLEQFRNRPSLPPGFLYQFEDSTLFDSDKAIVRFFRKLLRPFLKLLFNPNVLSTTLHTQAAFNQYVYAHQPLQFELLHNLVLELTRTSIEVKNLKMRLESVQSRLEFNERRARALEAVVQYKPEAGGRGRGEGRGEPRGEGRGEARGDARREARGDTRGQAPQGRPGQPHAAPGAVSQTPARPAQGPPAGQAPPAPAHSTAPAGDLGEPDDAGTEPLGGVDPITGGESVRTRRRRRRRRRSQASGEQGGATDEVRPLGTASAVPEGGAEGDSDREPDLKIGATDDARTWGTASAVPEGGSRDDSDRQTDLKVGATDEGRTWGTSSALPEGSAGGDSDRQGDLKIGATDDARTWGTASTVPESGAAGDSDRRAIDEARLEAGTTDDQTPR